MSEEPTTETQKPSKVSLEFPDNSIQEFNCGTPLVILGANGAGKTRFGIKLEELNDPSWMSSRDEIKVHRISAQKSLNISTAVQITGLEASKRNVFLGNNEPGSYKFIYKFGQNPATHLLNDFDKSLALLFAKNNAQLEKQRTKELKEVSENKKRSFLDESLVEKVTNIWNLLLPKRKISLIGNEVFTYLEDEKYHGKEMSDGERVILYMIVQSLVIESGTTLIIDEPELHVHKAILYKLWNILEDVREDCLFIYITHDLDFAVSRNTKHAIWIKKYDSKNGWDFEFIDSQSFSQLPAELLYEVIGTQKKIIFVEGTKDSPDYLLYKEIYTDQDYHVIPCGGCREVINYVKAKKGYENLNSLDVYGIIDRDYRCDHELSKLENDGIFSLSVAEVENLFVIPELLEIMSARLCAGEAKLDEAKQFIIKLYNDVRKQQIMLSFLSEVEFQLDITHFDRAKMTPQDVQQVIYKKFELAKIEEVLTQKKTIFIETDQLKDILKIFNYKELPCKIGKHFGIANNEYTKKVLHILRSKNDPDHKKAIDALKTYIPHLP